MDHAQQDGFAAFVEELWRHSLERVVKPHYSPKLLVQPYAQLVGKTHKFLTEQFGKDEMEPLSWTRHAIKQQLYMLHCVCDISNEVVAASNTQYIHLGEDKAVVVIWQIATAEEYRSRGVAWELILHACDQALERARQESRTIIALIGEVVEESEGFFNALDMKRVYYTARNGNVCEVPYLCPPVDMDSDTGQPLTATVPEHLMVRLFGSKIPTARELVRIVWSLYNTYLAGEEDYTSREAYITAREYMKSILQELERTVMQAKTDDLLLLSAKQRVDTIWRLQETNNQLIAWETKEN